MAVPPKHRLTHEPVLIIPDDDAWLSEKIINDEKWVEGQTPERGPCPWPTSSDHPVYLYHAGKSRYDLSTVREWIDESKAPFKMHLRRLNLAEWGEYQTLANREPGSYPSLVYAIRHGLADVTNADDFKPERIGGVLTMASAAELRDKIGEAGFRQLGLAIVMVSLPLLDTEKKA